MIQTINNGLENIFNNLNLNEILDLKDDYNNYNLKEFHFELFIFKNIEDEKELLIELTEAIVLVLRQDIEKFKTITNIEFNTNEAAEFVKNLDEDIYDFSNVDLENLLTLQICVTYKEVN